MIDPFKTDLHRRVIYRRFVGDPPTFGTITSFNPDYVFVQFDGRAYATPCPREDLTYVEELP